LSDGSVMEVHPLAAELNVPTPAAAWPPLMFINGVDSGLTRFWVQGQPKREIVYDYLRHHVVLSQQLSPSSRCSHFLPDKALFVTDHALEIRPFAEGAPVQRIDYQQSETVYDAKFMQGGERVCALNDDQSVHVYDIASGKLLQVFRSRAWILPTFVSLLAGLGAWAVLWVRHSLRSGAHPIWDVAVLNGLVLGGLLLRVFLQGSLKDPNREVFQYLEALGASWMLLLVLWFVLGEARWSIKVMAPVLGLVATLSLAQFAFRGDRQGVWELLVGGLGFTIAASVIFGFARRWGWRLTNTSSHWNQAQSRKRPAESRMPLRDIFLVIAASGVLFAVVRFIPASRLDLQSAGMLGLLTVTTATAAIGGAWVALDIRHWLLRIVLATLVVLFAGSIHSLVFPQFYNWDTWMWQLRFAGLVVVFSCASLLVFRVRGWRCGRFLSFETGER